ncbi:aldolase [Corynebacterium sp. HMSC036E10]|uniref:HpcH/HpaI aldolase family protein n=1 Tax=Corynebacterium TaxID=1716 RepID=UPI0008A94E44|nr:MULTISPECIES: aldolase/citrate lyase family protein [Corynebacterium]OHO31033.1 aldolase [Corynebacterium sp. HMSC034B08]OHO83338.1 aldolase [Corynebacterium sp. HMSC036E10]UBI09285.1 hypothetical protein LA324_01155 [Corynebacterium coyleae]
MQNTKKALREGATFHGQWLMSASTELAFIASNAGFNYVCLDMQHGFIRANDLWPLSNAVRAGGDSMVVARVPDNRFTEIGMLADAGVDAVIVPLVSTKEEAEAVASALSYPASGGTRSWGPTLQLMEGTAFAPEEEARPLVFIMIETAEAMNNLDEILSVKGIDGVYIGPSDLAYALGSAPGPEEPVTTEAIQLVLDKTVAAGLIPGIHTGDGQTAAERRKQGFKFITTSSDIGAARKAFIEDLQTGKGE